MCLLGCWGVCLFVGVLGVGGWVCLFVCLFIQLSYLFICVDLFCLFYMDMYVSHLPSTDSIPSPMQGSDELSVTHLKWTPSVLMIIMFKRYIDVSFISFEILAS